MKYVWKSHVIYLLHDHCGCIMEFFFPSGPTAAQVVMAAGKMGSLLILMILGECGPQGIFVGLQFYI